MLIMQQYDFDIAIKREGTSCVKYDLREANFGNTTVIPMWVADMDIPTPDFIIKAIKDRCNHPFLGYSFRDEAYSGAIVNWYGRRHDWQIKSDWIEFCPGVVAGLNHAIRAFTKIGDKIIIQPPVYHPFYSTVESNGRNLVLSPLVESNGIYTMDYAALERMAMDGAKMLILSSPHNPVGRVWSRQELIRLGEICAKHNVLIIADEIHSDLVYVPHKHVSIASINDLFAQNTVTFASSSKTFNIAGLASGFVLIPNAELMQRYKQELESSGAGMGNVFGNEAVKAAFTPQGEEWLNGLLSYFSESIDLVESVLQERLPRVRFVRPQGTYLLWLDFRALGFDDETLNKKLINEAGLGLNIGNGFGKEGAGFQRMNIACPRSTVQLALERLVCTFKDL